MDGKARNMAEMKVHFAIIFFQVSGHLGLFTSRDVLWFWERLEKIFGCDFESALRGC